MSLTRLAAGCLLVSLGAASFCFQPSEGKVGAIAWPGLVHGELSSGRAGPPTSSHPKAWKPGLPSARHAALASPQPGRWGRPPSGGREEAVSSIVLCGCRKRPRGPQGWAPPARPALPGAQQAALQVASGLRGRWLFMGWGPHKVLGRRQRRARQLCTPPQPQLPAA